MQCSRTLARTVLIEDICDIYICLYRPLGHANVSLMFPLDLVQNDEMKRKSKTYKKYNSNS